MEAHKTQKGTGKARTKANTLLVLVLALALVLPLVCSLSPKTSASYSVDVTYSGLSYDSFVYKTGGNYATQRTATTGTAVDYTNNTIQVGQAYEGDPEGDYTIWRGYVYFDTSNIPDEATVTAAYLSLYKESDAGTYNIFIQNGTTSSYPHIPTVVGDYYYSYYSGSGGNQSTFGAGYTNITLSASGLQMINMEGTTKLCLRTEDDINGDAPTTTDYLNFYGADNGASTQPKLYVSYSSDSSYSINLYGAYNEQGTRDGAINCTFTRPAEDPITFELNGTYATGATSDTRLLFVFDLGNNFTRNYFLRYDQYYEDVYVFKPGDVYTTYYVTLVDYVGVSNGYLESLLTINGTDRVVERQKIDVVNYIPYVLTWGTSYKFRLVCDEGTYTWQSVTAGADTTINLVVTSTAFPTDTINIGDISLSAVRSAEDTITISYSDAAELTNWVYVNITEVGDGTSLYSTNNTGNEQTVIWDAAEPDEDYVAYITIDHEEEGELYYALVCPALVSTDNPWDFGFLGDWKFDSSQLIGVFVVFCVFGAFSQGTAKVGIVATLLVASVFIYIGWLNITWGFFTVVFCLGILAVFSLHKEES